MQRTTRLFLSFFYLLFFCISFQVKASIPEADDERIIMSMAIEEFYHALNSDHIPLERLFEILRRSRRESLADMPFLEVNLVDKRDERERKLALFKEWASKNPELLRKLATFFQLEIHLMTKQRSPDVASACVAKVEGGDGLVVKLLDEYLNATTPSSLLKEVHQALDAYLPPVVGPAVPVGFPEYVPLRLDAGAALAGAGWFSDVTGKEWLVKPVDAGVPEEISAAEVIASRLYAHFGFEVPQVKIMNHKDRRFVAVERLSHISDTPLTLYREPIDTPEFRKLAHLVAFCEDYDLIKSASVFKHREKDSLVLMDFAGSFGASIAGGLGVLPERHVDGSADYQARVLDKFFTDSYPGEYPWKSKELRTEELLELYDGFTSLDDAKIEEFVESAKYTNVVKRPAIIQFLKSRVSAAQKFYRRKFCEAKKAEHLKQLELYSLHRKGKGEVTVPNLQNVLGLDKPEEELILYHGTIDKYKDSFDNNHREKIFTNKEGISLYSGKSELGVGLYTTTDRSAAILYAQNAKDAYKRAPSEPIPQAILVIFRVNKRFAFSGTGLINSPEMGVEEEWQEDAYYRHQTCYLEDYHILWNQSTRPPITQIKFNPGVPTEQIFSEVRVHVLTDAEIRKVLED